MNNTPILQGQFTSRTARSSYRLVWTFSVLLCFVTGCSMSHPPTSPLSLAEEAVAEEAVAEEAVAEEAVAEEAVAEEAVAEEAVAEEAVAEEAVAEEAESEDGFVQGTYSLIGRTIGTTLRHEDISRTIDNFSRRVDSFFGDERLYDEITETYASLKLSGLYERGGELSADAKFRLRLDLPRTKNRIKLRFETEDDEFDDEVVNALPAGTPPLGDNDVNASLQVILQETRNWTVSVSPGVKLRNPLDPYAKLRLRRSFNLFTWRLRFVQSFEWFDSTGYGSKSTLYFDRRIGERSLLRLTSEAYRNEEEYIHNDFRVSQRIYFFYALNKRVGLSTEAGIIGNSRPIWHHDRYFYNVRARRDIHEGFVFLELRPQIDFYHDNDFHGEPSVMLTIEVLYGADYTQ